MQSALAPGLAAALIVLGLGGCGPATQAGLAPGLVQRMDQTGARLDAKAALDVLNAYRHSIGAAALALDAALSAEAGRLAAAYAQSGATPKIPAGAAAMRVSAGYPSFADTFSGWRNSPPDAAVLARGTARRMGVGVASDANSTYGVYWVLLFAD